MASLSVPREDIARRRLTANLRESSHQSPMTPAPWSWMPSLRNCEKWTSIVPATVCDTLLQWPELRQPYAAGVSSSFPRCTHQSCVLWGLDGLMPTSSYHSAQCPFLFTAWVLLLILQCSVPVLTASSTNLSLALPLPTPHTLYESYSLNL